MTLPANIRVNALLPFPSRVSGYGFIKVAKSNGLWTITPDFSGLNVIEIPNGTQELLLYDPANGSFELVKANALAQLTSYRSVVATGNIVAQPTDGIVLLKNQSGAAMTVTLPQSAGQNGLPITVKDIGGNANTYPITFVPAAGETIDGFSAAAAAANGVAVLSINYGAKKLYPLTSGGWYLL